MPFGLEIPEPSDRVGPVAPEAPTVPADRGTSALVWQDRNVAEGERRGTSALVWQAKP